MLRYLLRAKPGDRPSSLAHTGEPLLESESDPQDDSGRPGPSFLRYRDVSAPVNGQYGGYEGPRSWAEHSPSDLVYYQNIASRYSVETGTAVLPGVAAAAAADGSRYWMGERTKMLPTQPVLPQAAIASLLNCPPPDAVFRHAFALLPPYVPAMQGGSVPASVSSAGVAWDGFAASNGLIWPLTSLYEQLPVPCMEVRGRA